MASLGRWKTTDTFWLSLETAKFNISTFIGFVYFPHNSLEDSRQYSLQRNWKAEVRRKRQNWTPAEYLPVGRYAPGAPGMKKARVEEVRWRCATLRHGCTYMYICVYLRLYSCQAPTTNSLQVRLIYSHSQASIKCAHNMLPLLVGRGSFRYLLRETWQICHLGGLGFPQPKRLQVANRTQ